jgi:SAM-dependent methyltransferase
LTTQFKDHFSGHSDSYAEFRPVYPASLFAYLASECAAHDCAWDCATGNGQAARSLVAHFKKVIASDASAEQIANAQSFPGVEFRSASAEDSGLDAKSIDLITVAQAMHWFDIEKFFVEADRVLKPGGILAVWCYRNCEMDPQCMETINNIFAEVEDYWAPERDIVESGYAGIEFPFTPLLPDPFEMRLSWTAADMLGYMRTWSAAQRYMREHGADPVSKHEAELVRRWGAGARDVCWPFELKISRK